MAHSTRALRMSRSYPGGDGVCFPPQEASGDGPDLVLDLIHNDSFGTDSQNQLPHHGLLLAAHAVEHHPVLW